MAAVPAPEKVRVPPLIVVAPVYVLAPVNVTVPLPVVVSEVFLVSVTPAPAKIALIVPFSTVYEDPVKVAVPVMLPYLRVTAPTVSLLEPMARVPPYIVTAAVGITPAAPSVSVPLMVVVPV